MQRSRGPRRVSAVLLPGHSRDRSTNKALAENGQRFRGPPAGVTTVSPARPDPELVLPHRQTGKEGGFPSLSVSVTSARLRLMQAFTQAFQPPARSQTPILTRFLNSGEAGVTSPLPRIGVLRGEELETHRDLEN